MHQIQARENSLTVSLFSSSCDLCGEGSLPMVSKGTHVIIPLVDRLDEKTWGATIMEQNGNKIKLSINSPASAVCGLYGITVTCNSSGVEAATAYTSSKNIVILFNPWCEGRIANRGEEGRGLK